MMQPPGPQPGPYPGQFPGQYPGQFPGPQPGQYPGGGGGGFGGGMGGLNLSDPATLLRIVVIALGALSLILLIAGTAVDEYASITVKALGTKASSAWGCQKVAAHTSHISTGETIMDTSCRGKFKYMYTLSFVIIFTTSILCVLQAAATAFNVTVVLLGKNQKLALILSSVLSALLLAVIIMANVNFSFDRTQAQAERIGFSEECVATQNEQQLKKAGEDIDRAMDGKFGRGKRETKRLDQLMSWGHSYGLVCSAFTFALINQILLIAIHMMAKSGASTFGALIELVKTSATNPAKIVRLGIFLVNLLLFVLMVTGTAHDRYIRTGTSDEYGCVLGVTSKRCGVMGKDDVMFEDAPKLAKVLFALTILICILLTVATALSVLQLIKDNLQKILTIPLLGLSGASTVFTLASIVVACVLIKSGEVIPKEAKYVFEVSFNLLATSLAFGLVNTGLNGFNLFLSMKGGFGPSGTTSNVNVSSTQPSSSGPVPPPLAPMGIAPTA